MERISRGLLLALFALLCCGQSRANVYDFSYTFDTGNVISGSFVGTPGSGQVTNLTDITASLGTTPLAGPLYAFSYTAPGSDCPACWVAGGAVASFTALQNNFLFIDTKPPTSLAGYTNYFYIIPWPNPGPNGAGNPSNPVATQYYNNGAYIDNYNGQFIPANWSLIQVPEPSMALLIVPAFMGIVGIRRKLAK